MNLLTRFLHRPSIAVRWTADDWNRFVPLARNARLLGRCLALFEQHGLLETVPPRLHDQMLGALQLTRYVQGQALRELAQVTRVLHEAGIRVMALKGVAYLAADLPPRSWRNLSDIDVMVAESDVVRAEQVLKRSGWIPSADYDAYDQHYYRDWMHEVPPLVHCDRDVEVDLHHNLAPPVSRIRIDAALLWETAVGVDHASGAAIQLLAPTDMLLHNAIHLFMNDELRGGLRDVVDFRDLYEHFLAQDPAFEQRLTARAAQLGCGRPLYYAMTTAQRLTGLQPSPATFDAVAMHAPTPLIRRSMHWLIEQTLAPAGIGLWRSALAQRLLFVRSHWVRMPLPLLLRHLWHKARKRHAAATPIEETPG
ncbi:MAG: nucleotidyltransferase family protein [Chromatiaceae bacterium]|nr:nucleotidyltransferase family protein [Chromatiaceae bacterium]